MARQFVGSDTLLENSMHYLTARTGYPPIISQRWWRKLPDWDRACRFSQDDISIQTEKGILTIEASKADESGNYIHQGIAKRAFSKMFRLAEYMKVQDAQFVDGILTVFLYKEVPDADRPKKININTKPKKLAKVS